MAGSQTSPPRSAPPRCMFIMKMRRRLDGLKGKTVAVLGYGSQGTAHANGWESGVKVIVANRRDSANGKLAISHGFEPLTIPEAVKQADLIIVTLPDELQQDIYNKEIKPHLTKGKTFGATHGLNVHFEAD